MSLGRIRTLRTSQDLSAGALDFGFEFGQACELMTIYLSASINITESITVSFDSVNGATYDTVIDSKIFSAEKNYVYAAGGSLTFNEGDKIRIQVTNANMVGTVYATVKAKVN